MAKSSARSLAAQVLARVRAGKSLSEVLPASLEKIEARERPLVQELCYGVCRWYFKLRFQADQLLKKPLKDRDHDVDSLVLLGLYQIQYLRVPDHAAVTESVEAARRLGKKWAAGLVNGVLRSFLRQREALEERGQDDAVRYAHPDWLLARLKTDWPEHWREIVEANNRQAPMSLRVNRLQTTRDDYLEQLAAAGIEATASPVVDTGIVLAKAVDVEQLPDFAEGLVSVQDIAAQLAAGLLDAKPGLRVLDACAAPGGKTAAILEAGADDVMALDVSSKRLERVEENLERLGLQASVMVGDVLGPKAWWDGEQFDRILLDAPCSATGVIRRHPDIRLLRREKDINALADTQRRMLKQCWAMLRPGGVLVYATCSVLPAENEQQVHAFVEANDDAAEQSLPMATEGWGHAVSHGWQNLPGEQQADGFYYAVLSKSA